MPGAGAARIGPGQAVGGQEAQDREGVRLLRGAGQPQLVRGAYRDGPELLPEHARQHRVADAAAGRDHLGRADGPHRVRDRPGRQQREGRQSVLGADAVEQPGRPQIPPVEHLLAGRLGRRQRVVRLRQQPVQQPSLRPPAPGQRAVRVVRLAPAAELPDGRVQQRAARTGVEGRPVRRGQVGDATDVQGHRPARPAAQPQQVDQADQRRALAAGRDVPGPEVGDHRQSGRLRDPRRPAQLERAVHPAAVRPVIDGLPVRGHQLGPPRAQFAVGPDGRRRERPPDAGVQPAHLGERYGGRRQGPCEGGAQTGVVRAAHHPQGPQQQRVTVEPEFGRRRVDRVVRRPRHQPDHQHRSPPSPLPFSADRASSVGPVSPVGRASRARALTAHAAAA